MAEAQPSTSTPTMTTGSNDQQSTEELLKQFVADALILKTQGEGGYSTWTDDVNARQTDSAG